MTVRTWTCQGCRGVWARAKQKCPDCGRKRPASKPPAHRAVLSIPYERWAETYGETCGICGAIGGTRRLHRDHDHRTGRARGLLCFPCNRALPNYADLDWMRRAVTYLENAERAEEMAA